MIIISHIKAKKQVTIVRNDKSLTGFSESLVSSFWEVCENYPEDVILWQEEGVEINTESIGEIFQHSLIMASYPVEDYFIPDAIGYVDQLPFVNPNKNVKYPTWRMSVAIGGIYGKTALRFKSSLKEISDFGVLINSMAKIGQQNSLFCYSHPALLKSSNIKLSLTHAGTKDLFCFVAQHYKKVRLLMILLCFIRYEKKFPIWSFINSVFKRSFFQFEIDLPKLDENPEERVGKESIDVIIPTLGRPQHLKNVLVDLSDQRRQPTRVIIVEQNPEVKSESQLDYLKSEIWPFEIVHHFTHQLGACNARNIALKHVTSEWVFFADDDIRFNEDLLYNAIIELKVLNVNSINFNCLNRGDSTVFKKIKQWGSFGSGSAIAKSDEATRCYFRLMYEHGYGEDADFGMQLRNKGVDIIYHPELQVNHLKAPIGGLRNNFKREWEKENIVPKPSPTLMAFCLRYYTNKEVKGFKLNLFLKYFNKQEIKNPFIYYRRMKRRWKKSMYWAKKIMDQENNNSYCGF